MKGLYIEVCEAPGNGASGARALAAAPGAETLGYQVSWDEPTKTAFVIG